MVYIPSTATHFIGVNEMFNNVDINKVADAIDFRRLH